MDIDQILRERNPWWRAPEARAHARPLRKRSLIVKLRRAVSDRTDRRAALLLGPRQVGKTTLLKQLLDELLDDGWPGGNLTFFDFSDDRLAGSVDPRAVLECTPPTARLDQPRLLFLDELQRYPRWADWLKGEVDRERYRILGAGSSMSLLRKGSIESGQGRWDEFHLEGLTFRETLRLLAEPDGDELALLATNPQLFPRYLETGGFPEFALRLEPSPETRERLRSDIASKAILHDLLLQESVDVDQVMTLFLYVVTNSGAIFNANRRAADLGANRKSISHWARLLQDTGLVVPLPRARPRGAGREKASRQLRPQPKLYAADHGLIRAFASGVSSPAGQDWKALVYEAVVFRQLRDLAGREDGLELSYLRENDDEVDFIVDTPDRRVGVEVTSSGKLDRKRAGLRRLVDRGRLDRVVLVHGGLTMSSSGNEVEVPLREFVLDPNRYLQGEAE